MLDIYGHGKFLLFTVSDLKKMSLTMRAFLIKLLYSIMLFTLKPYINEVIYMHYAFTAGFHFMQNA